MLRDAAMRVLMACALFAQGASSFAKILARRILAGGLTFLPPPHPPVKSTVVGGGGGPDKIPYPDSPY
jgi:hypothetical protein